jgi:hypothetical protein
MIYQFIKSEGERFQTCKFRKRYVNKVDVMFGPLDDSIVYMNYRFEYFGLSQGSLFFSFFFFFQMRHILRESPIMHVQHGQSKSTTEAIHAQFCA